MDCDVGLTLSETDVTQPDDELNSPYVESFDDVPTPAVIPEDMGLENTVWNDEPMAIPLPPPPSSLIVLEYNSADATPFSDALGIYSPVEQSAADPLEDPLEESSKGEPGVCGLRNLGNTCFMSAGVQSLMATAPIVVSLIRTPIPLPHMLTRGLAELAKMIWTSNNSVIQPSHFKDSLVTHFPQFNDYRQHDCQEFLALLLDGLHEQMNTAAKKVTNIGLDGGDSPYSSCKKFAQMDDQFHPSTSHGNCDQSMKVDGGGDHPDAPTDILEVETKKSCSSSEMNNVLTCKFLSRKEKSDTICENQLNNIFPSAISGDNPSPDIADGNNLHVMNNSLQQFSGLEDILKTAKTSNINVLIEQEGANNEIRFDSEKYPRIDNPRRRGEQFNVNSFHLYENNTGGKRCKSSVTYYSCAADFKEGLDMKRVKLNSAADEQDEKNKKMELERQNKHGEPMILEKNQRCKLPRVVVTYYTCEADFKEDLDMKRVKLNSAADKPDKKNQKMELERHNGCFLILEKSQQLACERFETAEGSSKDKDAEMSSSPEHSSDLKSSASVDNEGEEHWRSHLAANRSVIVDTFQGQFKSTVVCSACDFVSVTYEPFMYLSVPLPNALQRNLSVTFLSASSNEATVSILQVNQDDSVGTLKEQLKEKIDCDRAVNITMAEVLDNHISKILDDSFLIRRLNDSDRRLYAFEIVCLPEIERAEDPKGEETAVDNSCTICLEEKPHLKQHEGCTCKLCDQCISASCLHSSSTYFKCPVCRKDLFPDVDFEPVRCDLHSTIRMINVPVVFRIDKIGDGNNQKSVELFGHPRLLRIPSTVPSETLHGLLKGLLPSSDQYKVLLVDGKGHNCSRCMYTEHCRGCIVNNEGDIDLTTSDTLAVAYSSLVNTLTDTCRTESAVLPPHKPLTLYDCIQAFSKSEQLDGNNPWFCPHCQENRCATKTLTVWRCPDYLIVYLKRFVFRNHIITKLEEKVIFPLSGLTLPSSDSAYDLYACVCHVGGVSAGHYTSYAQHPYTEQWHHFNDSFVTTQQPQEEDYNNGYILFYRKQGIEVPALSNEDVADNLD